MIGNNSCGVHSVQSEFYGDVGLLHGLLNLAATTLMATAYVLRHISAATSCTASVSA